MTRRRHRPNRPGRKSSFSSGDGNTTCLEVAKGGTGSVHLRESDDPGVVLSTSKPAVQTLLGWAKGPTATGRR
ncbi:DUF397 domain-containing protein [Streptomyces varsoviensis]|uniref:DUF397 domain-containing protein n=1 Tax=Streptomyces varsoviensis TaxID=67373 RepID=UPI00099896BE|nr:DUF397 domain-containing protein [Streptomyces varsoviensis]